MGRKTLRCGTAHGMQALLSAIPKQTRCEQGVGLVETINAMPKEQLDVLSTLFPIARASFGTVHGASGWAQALPPLKAASHVCARFDEEVAAGTAVVGVNAAKRGEGVAEPTDSCRSKAAVYQVLINHGFFAERGDDDYSFVELWGASAVERPRLLHALHTFALQQGKLSRDTLRRSDCVFLLHKSGQHEWAGFGTLPELESTMAMSRDGRRELNLRERPTETGGQPRRYLFLFGPGLKCELEETPRADDVLVFVSYVSVSDLQSEKNILSTEIGQYLDRIVELVKADAHAPYSAASPMTDPAKRASMVRTEARSVFTNSDERIENCRGSGVYFKLPVLMIEVTSEFELDDSLDSYDPERPLAHNIIEGPFGRADLKECISRKGQLAKLLATARRVTPRDSAAEHAAFAAARSASTKAGFEAGPAGRRLCTPERLATAEANLDAAEKAITEKGIVLGKAGFRKQLKALGAEGQQLEEVWAAARAEWRNALGKSSLYSLASSSSRAAASSDAR